MSQGWRLDRFAVARELSKFGDGPFPPHPPTRDPLADDPPSVDDADW